MTKPSRLLASALPAVFCLFPLGAIADEWTGQDKQLHFAVSAVLGIAAYSQTHDRAQAFGWALAPGILKEVIDSQQDGNDFSGKDLAWDALGALAGAQVGHWTIGQNRVNWVKEF